uniref:Transmembrane protein n=1 Tax=Arabidopsis thaliana TaxID=3702 RepID=Q8LDU9_ARATH|nr:unknown [Arabidopsis thaliana]
MAMASSSISSSLFPIQQQPQQQLGGNEITPMATNANLIAAPNAPNHYSSSSIGPFFAVISVLIILAVLSCFLGRFCARSRQRTGLVAEVKPLEMIKSGGLLGWLRRKWRRCLAGDVEAGAKVADCASKETPKDNDQIRLEAPPA